MHMNCVRNCVLEYQYEGSHESVTSTPMPSWLVGLSAAGGEFFLRLGAREKAAAPHVTDRLHDDGRIIKSVFQTKHEERAWPHARSERKNQCARSDGPRQRSSNTGCGLH